MFESVCCRDCWLPALAVRADDGITVISWSANRAAGMGGAANASCSGVDAIYYNPAGLGAPGTNLIAVSGSLYGWQMYRADDATGPGEDANTNRFCHHTHLGGHGKQGLG
jgi:hypothetical protein